MKKVTKNKHTYKGEFVFEQDIRKNAPLFKCAYIKIPDAVKTKNSLIKMKGGGFTMAEDKRPCDGIMITPSGNYMIECKFNYGKLKDHQMAVARKVDDINDSFFILRKKIKVDKKTGLALSNYTVEKKDKSVLLESDSLADMLSFFKNL